MRGGVQTCSACGTKAPGPPYPRGWYLNARGDGIVCPSCSPSSSGHVVIVHQPCVVADLAISRGVQEDRRRLTPRPKTRSPLAGASSWLDMSSLVTWRPVMAGLVQADPLSIARFALGVNYLFAELGNCHPNTCKFA
jgi:hypothetical protein